MAKRSHQEVHQPIEGRNDTNSRGSVRDGPDPTGAVPGGSGPGRRTEEKEGRTEGEERP